MADRNSKRYGWVGLVVSAAVLLAAVACGGPSEPIQTVKFRERLTMDISQRWVPLRASGKKASYKLGESKKVQLVFEDQTRDYGVPMTVQGTRSAIGSELNLAYGNVDARVSYGGNALLTYPRSMKYGSKKVYTYNWVVAKPIGYSAVGRVCVTLRVPAGEESSPEVVAMIEQLDEQVGDAEMPQV